MCGWVWGMGVWGVWGVWVCVVWDVWVWGWGVDVVGCSVGSTQVLGIGLRFSSLCSKQFPSPQSSLPFAPSVLVPTASFVEQPLQFMKDSMLWLICPSCALYTLQNQTKLPDRVEGPTVNLTAPKAPWHKDLHVFPSSFLPKPSQMSRAQLILFPEGNASL